MGLSQPMSPDRDRKNYETHETYLLLLHRHDLRPTILLIRLCRRVRGAVLLKASLHAIDGAAADFEAAVDGRGIDAGF